MAYKDIREFVSFLEEKGELRRISEPVSSELEIAEIADRAVKGGGPALLFENVDGGAMPVLINVYGTHRRTAWALGVNDVDELAQRVRKLLGLAQAPPPGLVDKVRAAGELLGVARTQPKVVRNGPCQQVVLTGDDVDLGIIPVLKCWPGDSGPQGRDIIVLSTLAPVRPGADPEAMT